MPKEQTTKVDDIKVLMCLCPKHPPCIWCGRDLGRGCPNQFFGGDYCLKCGSPQTRAMNAMDDEGSDVR